MTTTSSISPSSDWLSAAELSALALPGIGVSRGSVLLKAQKEGWRSRMVSGHGGKHYEFHLRSLPREALEAYAERLLGPEIVAPLKQINNSVIDTVINTFTAGLKLFQKEVMDARSIILAEIDGLVEDGIGRSIAIDRFVNMAQSGDLTLSILKVLRLANARSGLKTVIGELSRTISRSTLYLWIKERSERGIAALAPKSIFRSPYIPAWAPAVMKLYGQPQKPSLLYVMEKLPKLLPDPAGVPSYSQVRRFMKRLTTQTRNQGRMGQQKLKSMKAYIQRDVSELWPGAVYAADGHRFDAEVAHPRHGRPFRPEITSVIDVYSRKIVGWSIALDEDTWGVLDAARHAFEESGLPDIWYVDNGKGFNNKNWDDELTGFMARLGITKKNSLPYNSQARGVIERLHQSLWVRSAKSLTSFVGKDMDDEAKRRQYKLSRSDIKNFGRTSHVMSWDDFMAWAGEQVEAYNGRPHSFLPRVRDQETFKRRHMTPDGAWQAGIKDIDAPRVLTLAQKQDLTRPYIKRRTNRALVNLFGNRYFAQELEAYHGEDVLVGYDIHDASQVWVRDLEQRLISVATFEGNKQSFFPVEVARKAHQEKLARSLKLIDQKRGLITDEQEAMQFETNLKSVARLNDADEELELQSRHTEAFLESLQTKSVEEIEEIEDASGEESSDQIINSRPIFSDTGDWLRWITGNPAEITEEDISQLNLFKHQNSFLLMLDTLGISFSEIEVLMLPATIELGDDHV